MSAWQCVVTAAPHLPLGSFGGWAVCVCVCVCVCVAPGLWHSLSLLHGLYPDMMLHACTAGGGGGAWRAAARRSEA